MNKKTIGLLVSAALVFPYIPFASAQTSVPATTDTTTVTEPRDTTTTEPAPTTDTAPVEKTVTPPADTTTPAFVSVATASSEESGATIVWTTDEPAYGFVEYGETASYGLATLKSATAEMSHTVSVTGLTPGTTYHYRIIAEDESGNRSYSQDRTLETAVEAVVIDNVPPEITDVSVANITTSEATVSWTTNEMAQGRVEYGKTAEYGASSPLADDYAMEHSTMLSNLDSGTEYHYRVLVQDESGNEASSPDEIFITDAVPTEEPVVAEPEPTATTTPETQPSSSDSAEATTDTETSAGTADISTTPPEDTSSDSDATSTPAFTISHVETSSVGTSTATIIWTTNEPASSQVFYGPGETYGSSTPVYTVMATSHRVTLTQLKPGTNYFYKVISANASGKSISREGFELNTLYQQKETVKPPAISNVLVSSISTSTATIFWNTDIPAGGEVRYGTTTAYGTSDGGHTHLLTSHTHPLSGLSPDTRYNFVAIARDSSGNETIYENKTFRTSMAESTGTSEVTSGADLEEIDEDQPTVTDKTTEEESVVGGGAGGGGGGRFAHTPTTTLSKPKLTKVEALDGQVMFVWNPQKPPRAAPGSTQIRTNIVIVRSTARYPEAPTFGTIVYKGNGGIFSDTKLKNGKTYYYTVFKMNQFNSYSAPARFKTTPTKADTEMALGAVPPVVQKNPIYTFSKTLSRDDKNKQVEHMQVLLASEPSLYRKGLVTGYFGQLTEQAVKAFQKRYQLPPTGVADMATLKKLEQLSSIEITKDKADVYDKAWARDLTVGRTGGDVSVLQQFLINAKVYPEALVTGYFGPLTKAAVQKFQREQNITPAEGFFGPVTKKRILNLIRLRSVSF